MLTNLRKWLQISLVNLLCIACIGVILRYKIAYSLPFIDQKYLLHAHSHFAFAGWITQALMSLLVAYLSETSGENYFRKTADFIASQAQLWYLCPSLRGMQYVHIVSTASVFVSYFFNPVLEGHERQPGKQAMPGSKLPMIM
jgi:hypothetical protein